MRRAFLGPCLMLPLLMLGSGGASAHGIWSHIHVTGWAIESLPDGDVGDFFAEPEVMNAALFGAAFTDSGYWPQGGELAERTHAYSEHLHWEDFIDSFIQWIRANDPPPWTELESRKRVAFLFGVASHGLQDEIFDSLFLPQMAYWDGEGQDVADPSSDAALVHAGLLKFVPEAYVPTDTLLELFEQAGLVATAEDMEDSVALMTTLYVNGEVGPEVALTFRDKHLDQAPWAFEHFFDEAIPGSVQSEIAPTAASIQALWTRLHGTFGPDDARVHAYPSEGSFILGRDPENPGSWITFIYGIGTKAPESGVTLQGEDGAAIPLHVKGTRWGATFGRLHRFMPQEALIPGAHYVLDVPQGLELIDGTMTESPLALSFRAPCDADDPTPCEDGPGGPPGDTPADDPMPTPTENSGCAGGDVPPWSLLLAAIGLILIGRRRLA